MAIKGACRYKPDTYRSSLSTTIADFNPSATPPSGRIVMTAQFVAFDDAVLTNANYQAGDPVTERNIVLLYEEAITKELSVFDAMTQAQATAEWSTALAAFRDRVLPAGPLLVKAIRAARIAPPLVIG